VAKVTWVTLSNPSPYRDGAYSCCLLGDVVFAVGFDEVMGVGRQRYRVEARSIRDGYILGRWTDEKVHRVASLYSCVATRNRVFAVGAAEGFWSVIVFDRELAVIRRRDFEKPRFIPYAVDSDGDLLFVAGAELLSAGLYAIHVEAISVDDLTPIARHSSNPRERGAAAYTITFNPETRQVLVGGFDNIDGYRSYRVEVLNRDLSLAVVARPGLRGAVTGISPGPQGTSYAVGRSGVVKISREGSTIMTNTTRSGIKIAFSATPPLDGRVAVVTDNNLHVLDENLGAVETTRIARGTEVLAATQGRVAADTTNIYIAMTQILTDVDWGWSIIAVNPRPARRFGIFGR